MGGHETAHEDRIDAAWPGQRRTTAVRVSPPRGGERQMMLDQLRRVALHEATAEVLERRAAASASPVLATLLAERATRHRGAAARMREAPQPGTRTT